MFPTPPPFSKKREREGRTIEDGRDSDRPRAYEAQGLDRKTEPRNEKIQTTIRDHSPVERIKDLGGVQILHRGLGGYTRRVRSRAPTEKSYDAVTPVHEPLSL
jgi:hypothetical protein